MAVTAASAPKVPMGARLHDPADDPEHHVRQCADDLDQGFALCSPPMFSAKPNTMETSRAAGSRRR